MNIVPSGMPVPLLECPPGLFIFGMESDDPCVGFKTEYGCHNPHDMECYVVETGESFWGGTDNRQSLGYLRVVPAQVVAGPASSEG